MIFQKLSFEGALVTVTAFVVVLIGCVLLSAMIVTYQFPKHSFLGLLIILLGCGAIRYTAESILSKHYFDHGDTDASETSTSSES